MSEFDPNFGNINTGTGSDVAGPLSDVGMGPTSASSSGSSHIDIAAIINGLIGFMSGQATANAAKASADQLAKNAALARTAATPENFMANFNKILPQFREAVAQGAGPQAMSDIDKVLSDHGLLGTGAGTAIEGLKTFVPSALGFQGALNEAGRLQTGQIGAALGAAQLTPGPTPNSLIAAIAAAARGYFGTRATPGTTGTPLHTDLFPNINPNSR